MPSFHIPINSQSRKSLCFHAQGQSYQFKALPFSLSTAPMEFTVVVKEVKLMALHTGIRIHQYLHDWLARARPHQTCLQQTQNLVALCQELGWMVNMEKSELDPKQIFNIVGYQFNLKEGKVRPTLRSLADLNCKDTENALQANLFSCLVWKLMSFISLLTATEKQVHLVRLDMRSIQWHLKKRWMVPESLEKVIPVPRSLHPSLKWWLQEENVLQNQLSHPPQSCSANLYRHIKRRVGHIYKQFLKKDSLSGPKRVPRPLLKQDHLITTDNTTVVAYMNKEGLCALLWRILTWYSRKQVTLKARHISCWLNVIADKLSRLGQTIHPKWSLLSEVDMHQKAPASSGSVCKEVQQQIASICVSSSRPPSLESGCTQPAPGGFESLCLPTGSHLGQSG